MTLPELAVMQQTFELLHQLDPSARRRVLKWVKAALDETDPAPAPAEAPAEPIGAEVGQVTEPGDTGAADQPAAAADEPAPAGRPTPADTAGQPDTADTADTAGEPAPAMAGEASADEPDEATTPAAKASDRPGRRATKKAARPARGRAATKTTPAAEEASPVAGGRGRPPAEEIMRVYQEVDGKLTGVAEHYGKPYGTVQGWASTLRKQGYPIGRSRNS